MSAQYIDHESSHYLARYPQQDPFKVSRDDLIDEPPSPYSASAQHKVYVVPTSPTETRRGLSYPLDQLQSYSSEATTKASTEVPSSTSRSYLPSLSTADTEIRGLWKTVSHINCLRLFFSHPFVARFCPNQSLVDYMSSLSSYKLPWISSSKGTCWFVSTKQNQ
jgi:hypothetical protein